MSHVSVSDSLCCSVLPWPPEYGDEWRLAINVHRWRSGRRVCGHLPHGRDLLWVPFWVACRAV